MVGKQSLPDGNAADSKVKAGEYYRIPGVMIIIRGIYQKS